MSRNIREMTEFKDNTHFGLFVRGNGTTRDGQLVVDNGRILISSIHSTSIWFRALEAEVAKRQAKGEEVQVLELKPGAKVWRVEHPEECVVLERVRGKRRRNIGGKTVILP